MKRAKRDIKAGQRDTGTPRARVRINVPVSRDENTGTGQKRQGYGTSAVADAPVNFLFVALGSPGTSGHPPLGAGAPSVGRPAVPGSMMVYCGKPAEAAQDIACS
jgi:hypothetical protein